MQLSVTNNTQRKVQNANVVKIIRKPSNSTTPCPEDVSSVVLKRFPIDRLTRVGATRRQRGDRTRPDGRIGTGCVWRLEERFNQFSLGREIPS